MMSISVPSKLDEKFVYIWKIIDRKEVDWKELVYYIAYELHISEPAKVKKDIIEAIKQGYLIQTKGDFVRLNDELKSVLDSFQKHGEIKAKKIHVQITKAWGDSPILTMNKNSNLDPQKEGNQLFDTSKTQAGTTIKNSHQPQKTDDNPQKGLSEKTTEQILELLTVKSTVQSGMKLKQDDVIFEMKDFEKGLITGKIKGTIDEPYLFQIDVNMKVLSHNCTDFSMKRVRKKELCKHLVKVFQLLMDEKSEASKKFINDFVENKLIWKFNG